MVSLFKEGTCHLPIYLLCVPIVFLASKCLTCQSPTTGIDIHLCQTIPITTKPKISIVSLSISNGLFKQYSLPITLSSWSMGHLLKKRKKTEAKKKRDKTHTSTQTVEIRSSNKKKTKCFLSVSPFPPSP